MKKRVLLAYSGGLDTSAIIPWLKENHGAEIIAFCCNLGNQPDEALLKKQAMDVGACDFVFEDVQDKFADHYILPLLRSGATYFDDYLLGTAIARPLIAERTSHWAKKMKADYLAHGATGKGNDHIRFERAWAYLCPEIPIIAPWKTWDFKGRQDLIRYLESKGIPWLQKEKRFSVDVNLLHRSCEGGVLEHLNESYDPNEVYGLVNPGSPEKPTTVSLKFHEGNFLSLNGEIIPFAKALELLNEIAGKHGIGVVDLVEERTNGLKSRGIYETPGGTIVFQAFKELKRMCWSRELYLLGQKMAQDYGRLVYDGLWFSDARIGLESFFGSVCGNLTGEVELQLSGNRMIVTKRESPHSLYDMDQTTFEADAQGYNKASLGYTQFLTSPLRKQGKLSERKKP